MSSSSSFITTARYSQSAQRSLNTTTVAPIDTQISSSKSSSQQTHQQPAPPSPRAPAYSPITPKVLPVLPDNSNAAAFMPPPENGGTFTFEPPRTSQSTQSMQPQQQPHPQRQPEENLNKATTIAPTEFIPQPPTRPFSGEDATDAIALRAAISALQFQKMKAARDIQTLGKVKEKAVGDPDRFKRELAAGRLREQRPSIGDLRAILDEPEEGQDDEEKGEGEVVLGASAHDDDDEQLASQRVIPDSQPTSSSTSENMEVNNEAAKQRQQPFPRIPGPQNVVRMPYINWEKYHIVGEPLDAMHEQQRKHPGSEAFARNKGREHQVAAPYSPFLDTLEQMSGQETVRKDSAATSASPGSVDTKNRH